MKVSEWMKLVAAGTIVVLTTVGCGGGANNSASDQSGNSTASTSSSSASDSSGQSADTAAVSVEAGQELFKKTCATCHGPEGKGVPKLGKDLTTSKFAEGKSDEELVAFLKKGRPASDPLNTTKVDMPPKGGNPALTDSDLLSITKYVHSLEKK